MILILIILSFCFSYVYSRKTIVSKVSLTYIFTLGLLNLGPILGSNICWYLNFGLMQSNPLITSTNLLIEAKHQCIRTFTPYLDMCRLRLLPRECLSKANATRALYVPPSTYIKQASNRPLFVKRSHHTSRKKYEFDTSRFSKILTISNLCNLFSIYKRDLVRLVISYRKKQKIKDARKLTTKEKKTQALKDTDPL